MQVNINLISLGGIYTRFACILIEKISFMSFIFSEYGDIILHCILFLTHLYADVWVLFVSSLHFSSREVFGNIQAFLKRHDYVYISIMLKPGFCIEYGFPWVKDELLNSCTKLSSHLSFSLHFYVQWSSNLAFCLLGRQCSSTTEHP